MYFVFYFRRWPGHPGMPGTGHQPAHRPDRVGLPDRHRSGAQHHTLWTAARLPRLKARCHPEGGRSQRSHRGPGNHRKW